MSLRHTEPDPTVEDFFVRVRPDENARKEKNPVDRGWRLAFRGEFPPDGNVWISEERTLPERVDKPNAQRILDTKGSMCLVEDEQLWLLRTLLEFGGEHRLKQLIATLDHETAERWSVLCAERAIGAKP